jgi:hypothetical protein
VIIKDSNKGPNGANYDSWIKDQNLDEKAIFILTFLRYIVILTPLVPIA